MNAINNTLSLFSIPQTAAIFGISPSRLRYWLQTGLLWPSVRKKGRFFYTFADLVAVRTTLELLDRGISVQQIRKAVQALRADLPDNLQPNARLRIVSDGHRVLVHKEGAIHDPISGQTVMNFTIGELEAGVAKLVSGPGSLTKMLADHSHEKPRLTKPPESKNDGIPMEILVDSTEAHEQPSAYQCFLEGCSAEDRSDHKSAVQWYERSICTESGFAAAHTNLGNLLYAQGQVKDAMRHYQTALDHEPEQPEARFNLANILDERGETDLAVAELRQVCTRNPDFADAHYNLGLLLLKLGGRRQAQEHLEKYLDIDPESSWGKQAQRCLQELAA